jgi:triphosphoribosyl-dephospho-CoA synthase
MQINPFSRDEVSTAPARIRLVIDGDIHLSPRKLARLAVQALAEEAELTPKPALVDRRGSGAHHDLSLPLLLRSATALEPYFVQMAEAAWKRQTDISLREQLGLLGREAEVAMMNATRGINTHKGAIWALGLLLAAAAQRPGLRENEICDNAAAIASLPDIKAHRPPTNGDQVATKYGAGGARSEAKFGFPHVILIGLPALRRCREAGLAESCARVDTLLSIMASLEDTCLLHRGGRKALEVAHQGAAQVLEHGGSSTADGIMALDRLHESLMNMWASPGGSVDMLAATLFLDSLTLSQEYKA